MSAAEARRVCEANGLTAVDVAAATKIHPQTVQKFLKGRQVHRGNALLIETYLRQIQGSKTKPAPVANS